MSGLSYQDVAKPRLQVLADLNAVAAAGARHFAARASAAIAVKGRFTVALSGGSTPAAMFAILAAMSDLNWDKIHVFWGDERCVPPTAKDSNYLTAKQALLDQVPLPAANIHRIHAELEPAAAAAAYDAELRRFFQVAPGDVPVFDLIYLGMGDEGHTASLFPHTPGLSEVKRLVVSHPVAKLKAERITFTYPLLNAAQWVIVLLSGAGKEAIVKTVLASPIDAAELPMQGVRPQHGQLLWLLDQAAAASL